jgi:hypothetical protein
MSVFACFFSNKILTTKPIPALTGEKNLAYVPNVQQHKSALFCARLKHYFLLLTGH